MPDLDSLIGSIAIIPFPRKNYNHSLKALVALAQCPKCHNLGDFYSTKKFPPFVALYCKGNLPPEIECRNMIGGSTHKHEVSCAGVTIEHFHIKCSACSYQFFLGLPGDNNG